MSFDINWPVLTSGPEADQIKDYLNQKFASVQRPNFLGHIKVSEFTFGTIPPEIAIVDFTDPIPDFYYEESANSELNSNLDSPFVIDSPARSMPKGQWDCQVELSIAYKGDMKMTITTELIVNQPTPNFMTLPVKLTLTKTSLTAHALIAYIDQFINFCLLEPEDGGRILRDLTIESAIGDNNRQVLKNVGKIEKFIVQQLTEFLETNIVFPNYHTVCLLPSD